MGLKYPQRALDASYNNVASGLAANNVQEALDELAGAPWTSWTPTSSWSGGGISLSGTYKVENGWLFCNVKATFTGGPSGGTLEIPFPAGWQANSSAFVDLSGEYNVIGNGTIDDSVSHVYLLSVTVKSGDPDMTHIHYHGTHAGAVCFEHFTPTAPITIASGDSIYLNWACPVVRE